MSTAIEWTDATWNPTVGCDRISPGCANCYAKTLHDKRHAALLAGKKMAPQYARPFETLQMIDVRLVAPLHWRAPRRVFVNSVSDLFHEDVPDAFIDKVFAVMALAPQHTFQILTKRAGRMRDYSQRIAEGLTIGLSSAFDNLRPSLRQDWRWPLPNVWLGVSVENQHFADERIPLLLQTPAAVRFISAEPLLGPIDFGSPELRRNHYGHALDWVIVGGESGTGARPCAMEWVASVVRQCQAASVPVFVKQLGAVAISDCRMGDSENGKYLEWSKGFRDSKGGDPTEWPEDLRVREFPKVGQ